MKRIVLLTALLWVVLYVSEWLVHGLFMLIPAPLAENVWAVWLAWALPVWLAAWLIGRSRGLAGRYLALSSTVATLAVFAVAAVTALAVMSLPPSWVPGAFNGEVILALVYLVIAVEAVAVSWLVAGLAVGLGARRASASI